MDISVLTLSAAQLTSGTIPDARFPATLPAISGANLTNLPASGATLSGTTNNTIVTVTGSNAMIGESELTYDGTDFKLMKGGASATGASLAIETYNDGGNPARLRLRASHNDTQGTMTSNINDYPLGFVQFEGVQSGAFQRSAVIRGETAEAWDANGRGSKMSFYTTPNNTNTETKAMEIGEHGATTLPTQPAFQVYLSSDSGTGQNGDIDKVPFNSTSGGRDQGGYFNTTGSNETIRGITVLPYQFLAPVAGFYLLTCYIVFAGQGSGTDRATVAFDVVPNGGSMVRYNSRHAINGITNEIRLPFSMVVYVAANAQIRCSAGTYGAANQQATRKTGSWFSGILLG
tara:strand:+ start:295 stop:1332 length:1038 start_codon:yes stop_codon:yes gene_type:complete